MLEIKSQILWYQMPRFQNNGRPLNTSRLKRRLFLLFPSTYKSSNVQASKMAIFLDLRTFKKKNPLKSTPVLRGPKT